MSATQPGRCEQLVIDHVAAARGVFNIADVRAKAREVDGLLNDALTRERAQGGTHNRMIAERDADAAAQRTLIGELGAVLQSVEDSIQRSFDTGDRIEIGVQQHLDIMHALAKLPKEQTV